MNLEEKRAKILAKLEALSPIRKKIQEKLESKAQMLTEDIFSKVCTRYINNPQYRYLLDQACAIERNIENGFNVNSGTVALKGIIDEESGLWKIRFEVPHGTVFYDALDKDLYEIEITTIPNPNMLNKFDELKHSSEKLEAALAVHSNSMIINLRDTVTLREAKDQFANDYVLKNIPLNSGKGMASRFIVWHIRAYRKSFMDYYYAACDLWKGTGYVSATSLLKAIKGKVKLKQEV